MGGKFARNKLRERRFQSKIRAGWSTCAADGLYCKQCWDEPEKDPCGLPAPLLSFSRCRRILEPNSQGRQQLFGSLHICGTAA
jgi:hypothetical protein